MILALCGPPGSGKTTIATRVHATLQDYLATEAAETTDSRAIHLRHSDDYDRHPYQHFLEEVTASDDHFVLDGTFYKPDHQRPFLDLPDTHFVLVRADLDTCLRRDHARDGIGETAVRIIHSEFHVPPVDLTLDTDILSVDDAVRILTDRATEWLDEPATEA